MIYKTALLVAALIFTGCSTTSETADEGPKPVELGPSKGINTPEADLISEAKKLYESRLYAAAQTVFQQIKDGYPFGRYAEYAEVKIGDCHFYKYDYLTASMIYSEFVKQHPSSENAEYAMLQLGRSYKLQYSGKGRDMEPLQKAHDTLTEMLKKYPSSMYVSAAKKYLSQTDKAIIAHEKLVADYYKDKGHKKASLARLERAKQLESTFSEESSKLAAAATDSADTSKVVEVPKLYAKNYEPPKGMPQTEKLVTADIRVTRIACQSKNNQVSIFLNKAFSDENLKNLERDLQIKPEQFSFMLPNAWANPTTTSCFGSNDLDVTEEGKITLKTSGTPTFFTLNNPPRLIFITE
jgi:outer membrane protein assembly factor BamD